MGLGGARKKLFVSSGSFNLLVSAPLQSPHLSILLSHSQGVLHAHLSVLGMELAIDTNKGKLEAVRQKSELRKKTGKVIKQGSGM